MRYFDLEKHLSAVTSGGECAKPLYVIAGNDAYLRYNALNAFKSLVDDDFKDFNLTFVSQSDGVGVVEDALSTFPMFGDWKVVVVPDIATKLSDEDKDFVKTYVLAPNPTSILVAVVDCPEDDDDEKGSKKKEDAQTEGDGGEQNKKNNKVNLTPLAKTFCQKFGIECINCDHLERNEIANEVQEILDEVPECKMDANALDILIDYTKSDMSRISREVQKLKAYSGNRITAKDVEELVAPNSDYVAYLLTNAVTEKNADEALKIVNSLLGRGKSGVGIISMLYNQYRKMLHMTLYTGDDEQLQKLLDISGGQLYHLKRVAKNYSQVRLKKCVDYLHGLQYAIVSGKREELSAVHDAILTLLNA